MILTPRFGFVLSTLIGLTACQSDGTDGGAFSLLAADGDTSTAATSTTATSTTARGIRTLRVLDGGMRLRAPEGYCIDGQSSRPQSGFVVMAGCKALGGPDVTPAIEGLITIQVGDTGSATVAGSETEMAALLRSSDGRTLLSGSGNPGSVNIEQVRVGNSAVAVRFKDRTPSPLGAVQSEEWRAFLDHNNRLVTIGVRGYARNPITADQGISLIATVVAQLRSANPATPEISTASR